MPANMLTAKPGLGAALCESTTPKPDLGLAGIEFGARTYLLAGGLAAFYLLSAALVWLGAPFGRLCGRLCALLYLPRPDFGSRVWQAMDSPEFQAHFKRRPRPPSRSPGGKPETK